MLILLLIIEIINAQLRGATWNCTHFRTIHLLFLVLWIETEMRRANTIQDWATVINNNNNNDSNNTYIPFYPHSANRTLHFQPVP